MASATATYPNLLRFYFVAGEEVPLNAGNNYNNNCKNKLLWVTNIIYNYI